MDSHLEAFLQALADDGLGQLTLASYRSDLVQFGRWFETVNHEPLTPTALTPSDVRAYKLYLLDQHAKPATINRKLTVLRRLGQWLVAQGLRDTNPAAKVKNLEKESLAPRALTKSEVDALVRAVERHGTPRDRAIVEVLRSTGVRVSELVALCKSDVILTERKGKIVVRNGKGGKERLIPLNNDARKALDDYLETRRDLAPDAPVFGGQRAPLQRRGVWRVLHRYALLAGLRGVSPHVLRHTFATRLVREPRVDVMTTAKLTGHRNLNTLAVYTQPREADLEEAVEYIADSD